MTEKKIEPQQSSKISAEVMEELTAVSLLSAKRQREYVETFSEQMKIFFSVRNARPVGSGTDGLFHALLAVGVSQGSLVVTTANVWLSTITTIVEIGATPIFVDIDPASGQMDSNQLREVIKKTPSAIVVAHMYGIIGDVDAITVVANEFNIPVIEDSCQCFAVPVPSGGVGGTKGAIGVFSFHPNKAAGAPGSGGLVVTNQDAYARKIEISTELRWASALDKKQPRSPSRLAPVMIPFIRAGLSALHIDRDIRMRRLAEIDKICLETTAWTLLRPGERGSSDNLTATIMGPHARQAVDAFRAAKLKFKIMYPGSLVLLQKIEQMGFNIPHTSYLVKNHINIPLGRITTDGAVARRCEILIDIGRLRSRMPANRG